MIFGVDEVGLGALAGPLVVCAFAAPSENWEWPSRDSPYALKDSKKLSKKAREWLSERLISEFPNSYSLVEVPSSSIDNKGIARCLHLALNRAVEDLVTTAGIPDRVIIDGEDKGVSGAEFYTGADDSFKWVMAASIIAKVRRDKLMEEYAKEYSGYGFEHHSGYGTKEHIQAIKERGPCALHRKSFAPIRWLSPTSSKLGAFSG